MLLKNILCVLVLSAIVLIPSVFAGKVELTTYYPAPYGEYKNLNSTEDAYFATTSGSKVGIGTKTPQAVLDIVSDGGVMIIPRKTTAGDPDGINGMIYYNAAEEQFRKYENGSWKRFGSSGGVYSVGNSVPNTLVNTAMQDIPGMQIARYFDSGKIIVNLFASMPGVGSGGSYQLRVLVDNTQIASWDSYFSGDSASPIAGIATVSAGNHTIKAQWSGNSAGIMFLFSPNMVLTVMESE